MSDSNSDMGSSEMTDSTFIGSDTTNGSMVGSDMTGSTLAASDMTDSDMMGSEMTGGGFLNPFAGEIDREGQSQLAYLNKRDDQESVLPQPEQVTPTRSVIPIPDANGRPTHHLDQNGHPYPSALALLKEGAAVLKEEIAQYKHLPTNALHEYCKLFTRANTMTKYKKVQDEITARKAHSDRQDESEWDERVNSLIEEHLQEKLAMAEEAQEFLTLRFTELLNERVKEALKECIEVLESTIPKVVSMEKTYQNYDEVEPIVDSMASAIYDLNWICVVTHTS